jgi:hypothetical protein
VIKLCLEPCACVVWWLWRQQGIREAVVDDQSSKMAEDQAYADVDIAALVDKSAEVGGDHHDDDDEEEEEEE